MSRNCLVLLLLWSPVVLAQSLPSTQPTTTPATQPTTETIYLGCGNGLLDWGETCDDGNIVDGDGCSSNCLREPACGNGFQDPREECDDGNTIDGDGCPADCGESLCGNGVLDMGEVCDDGNNLAADGCRPDCLAYEACGNGFLDIKEECDDGNRQNGDGCDQNCTLPACGNNIRTDSEACDDGNILSGDGCSFDCQKIEQCGDGVIDTGEVCDDGNLSDGDLCAADCQTALTPPSPARPPRSPALAFGLTIGGSLLGPALAFGGSQLIFSCQDCSDTGLLPALLLVSLPASFSPSIGSFYARRKGGVLRSELRLLAFGAAVFPRFLDRFVDVNETLSTAILITGSTAFGGLVAYEIFRSIKGDLSSEESRSNKSLSSFLLRPGIISKQDKKTIWGVFLQKS